MNLFYFNIILSFLHSQPYILSLLLLFAEEAGIPLPAENILYIYLGYHVGKGDLPYIVAFALLLFAIICGSSLLFFLADRYGQTLVLKAGKYIHLNEKKLNTVEHYFKKHGFWFIILGRHIPGLRVPITVFSGMSTIDYKTFIMCVILSDVFTIPVYLHLGMRYGLNALQLIHSEHWMIYVIAALFLLPIIGVYMYQLYKKNH